MSMTSKTPTLPTVIITPSTPLYLLPTRQYRPITFEHHSNPNATPSSSRQYTRKQHLMSALELGPSLFPRSADLDKEALLLPEPLVISDKPSRRQPTVWLSLAVFALFGLILVGPILPYRWWTGSTTAGVPDLISPMEGSNADSDLPMILTAETDTSGIRKRWEAYGPGQGSDPRYSHAFGPGQAPIKRENSGKEQEDGTESYGVESDGVDLD